jgi:hypothetical protein
MNSAFLTLTPRFFLLSGQTDFLQPDFSIDAFFGNPTTTLMLKTP